MFGIASLALLHRTRSATKNSSKGQQQPLLMVYVKLAVHKSYECTALIDTGASFNSMSLLVVIRLGWALSTAEPVEVRFANGECLCSIGQSAGLV